MYYPFIIIGVTVFFYYLGRVHGKQLCDPLRRIMFSLVRLHRLWFKMWTMKCKHWIYLGYITFLWSKSCTSASEVLFFNEFVFYHFAFVSVMKPLSEKTGAEDSTAAVRTRSQGSWYKKKCCSVSSQICWSLSGAWLTGLCLCVVWAMVIIIHFLMQGVNY